MGGGVHWKLPDKKIKISAADAPPPGGQLPEDPITDRGRRRRGKKHPESQKTASTQSVYSALD